MKKSVKMSLEEFFTVANSNGIPTHVGEIIVDKENSKWFAFECTGFASSYDGQTPIINEAMEIVIS